HPPRSLAPAHPAPFHRTRDRPPRRKEPAVAADQPASVDPVPLAVAVIDGAGVVTHWHTDAGRLFGIAAEEAVGRPAATVLPASLSSGLATPSGGAGGNGHADGSDASADGNGGAGQAGDDADHVDDVDDIDHLDPERNVVVIFGSDIAELSSPCSGRYWTQGWRGDPGRRDVLWWGYPLLGPGAARLLLLAADGSRVAAPGGPAAAAPGVAPAFVPHTEFERPDALARRLPELLPPMSPRESSHITRRMLHLGYPALQLTGGGRIPVTADWRG
ncbi:hypothetical protein ACTWP5_18190, partial [Streptomyces sp. 4N509B]